MTQGLRVLIIDTDRARAEAFASLVARHGSQAAIAPDLVAGARMWSVADVAVIDDDAFGDAGLALAAECARTAPATFRCIAARQSRFQRCASVAAYVFAKPFGTGAVVDALGAAKQHVRRMTPGAMVGVGGALPPGPPSPLPRTSSSNALAGVGGASGALPRTSSRGPMAGVGGMRLRANG